MSKKVFKYSAVIASLLMAAVFAGCGTSHKEGNVSADSVARVSEADCIGCHSGQYRAERLTGDIIVEKYIASRHNQNLVGCQDCHGGGAQHNGIGPMPYPQPSYVQCKTCHSDISDAFADSSHGPTNFTLEFAEDEAHRICSRCHTHEGAILGGMFGYTGDETTLIANADLAPGLDIDGSRSSGMKCVTCHTTHKTEDIRVPKTVVAGTVVDFQPTTTVGGAIPSTNKQFNLCTSCHSYTTPAGTLVASGTTASGTAQFVHETAWYRIIGTTHYDNPATTTVVEGYVLRTNGANPCFDCHGHEMRTGTRYGNTSTPRDTTYTEWAESGHAGGLLAQKYAKATELGNARSTATVDAVMAEGVTEATGAAWVHYDWDSVGRQSCQRCHTATGAAAFMTDPTNYNAANNDFSHITAGQNEVLYCWGCHSDAAAGELRIPGARVETYAVGTAGDTAAVISYPDVSGSNVCLTCHVGREVGQTIKNDNDADGVRGFINSHYLTAGGTLFGESGYEYAGESYDNPSFFAHDKIGSADAPGTGSNGPCVGCHMSSARKHTFKNFSTNGSGEIMAVTSTACATCHTGNYALTPQVLMDEEEEFEAALEGLAAALAAKGIYFGPAYPYFYTAVYNPAGGNTGYTNWAGIYGFASWKDVMGAAFNYNLLRHDPGAFAHNRFYSKRLIWDSVDFIDDGTLNDSTPATLVTVITDATELAAAQAYLGTSRP